MQFEKTTLNDVWLIKPNVFKDERGQFFEAFRREVFKEKGVDYNFVQDNVSTSVKGTVRGLHYQKKPHSQSKLIMAIYGEIMDVAVDMRRNSPTFGKYFSAVLNDENHHMLLVPSGFAHGFAVLSETATVAYKCDQYYHKHSERGVRWNDPSLQIDWEVENPTLSEKDKNLPLLRDVSPDDFFNYLK